MSDPYSEATRYDRRRLSPLAKIMVIVAGCAALGMTALFVVGLLFVRKASDRAADFRENPAEAFAEMAERFADDVTVVETDEGAERVVVRFGDEGEQVTVDLAQALDRIREGVRFEGEASESGGRIRLRTADGETRIELRGDGDGGFLRIESPDGEMRFRAGDEAAELPNWVPVYPGARVRNLLFSHKSDTGRAGAAVLSTDAAVGDVVTWYEDRLDGAGYSTSVVVVGPDRGRLEVTSGGDGDEARKLSVVAGRDDDGSGLIFLLYGEGE
ncbi:MAG: hypothetical protein OXH51_16340 [Gemmatimonadetes bacterium]|nr:hypothetical protein [Gemmatimonadota bacterium]MCY3613097.1 hypothetical protein [Gemmatimonadota bacterium]MCY3678140.1 hypothetical protein [Gemmatimonadota bacterium]MYA42700.1 hypothetical protein [Gemmatimonadota bacterium]MYE94585.1 hypothetical protein [Gemmatimonadota bacterium]